MLFIYDRCKKKKPHSSSTFVRFSIIRTLADRRTEKTQNEIRNHVIIYGPSDVIIIIYCDDLKNSHDLTDHILKHCNIRV